MAILEEGAIAVLKKMILRFGRKSLGPSESVTAALGAIEDQERLERIHDRLGEIKTWEELLETE
jgi:hypothetical protein